MPYNNIVREISKIAKKRGTTSANLQRMIFEFFLELEIMNRISIIDNKITIKDLLEEV